MKIRIIITLCSVLFLSKNVIAEEEENNENKNGRYSFMAIIYYTDDDVVDASGFQFLRGAVLFKPDWLITSNVGPVMIKDTFTGFPRMTLMARLGAASIDANLTFNEDQDEQEREVIQVVRPHNYSKVEWWRHDVTLLKTLLPFNMTTAVGLASIRTTPGDYTDSECFMLVYSMIKKQGTWTEDKMLKPLYVELNTSSEACGNRFQKGTMMCTADDEDFKNADYDPEFCQGSSGGPLICEKEVVGIQTYVEDNCKPPYLYQHLPAWNNFITCGLENKCGNKECSNVCVVINKDDLVTKETTTLEKEQNDTTIEAHKDTAIKDGRKDTTNLNLEGDLDRQIEKALKESNLGKEHKYHFVLADVGNATQKEEITTLANKNLVEPEEDIPTKEVTATDSDISGDITTITTTKVMAIVPTTPIINGTSGQEETENTSLLLNTTITILNNTSLKTLDEVDVKRGRKSNVESQKILNKVNKKNSAERKIFVPLSLFFHFLLVSLMM